MSLFSWILDSAEIEVTLDPDSSSSPPAVWNLGPFEENTKSLNQEKIRAIECLHEGTKNSTIICQSSENLSYVTDKRAVKVKRILIEFSKK